MKKICVIVMALAMVCAFLVPSYAADTAQLGLKVTFAPSEPLKIWSEPEGPFTVEEGETLEFRVIAEDKDSMNVNLNAVVLPEGAKWIVDPDQPITINHREGTFRWCPLADSETTPLVYVAEFEATNHEDEEANLRVEIKVIAQVISIELNEPSWQMDGVKLGERRSNAGPDGAPIQMIKNTGNVPVFVDIGYSGVAIPELIPRPGLEQGIDTFITVVKEDVIPPSRKIQVGMIGTDETIKLPLVYGAPTGLSQEGISDMSTSYELRAYKAYAPQPQQ